VTVLRSLVRDGVVTPGEASAAVARPLPLRTGRPLPPLTGVDFAPGPAFVWWELVTGLVAFALGVAALTVARHLPQMSTALRVAVSIAAIAIAVLGAALVVRSFRSA
jgi:hypothetical protein